MWCRGKRIWQRYVIMLERGNPAKTVMVRLQDAVCAGAGQGGGGSIKMREWKPLALKWYANKKLVNHTDSAQSYRNLKVPGPFCSIPIHSYSFIEIRTHSYSFALIRANS